MEMVPLTEEEKIAPVIGKEYMFNVGAFTPNWKPFRVLEKTETCYLMQHYDDDGDCSVPVTWALWVTRGDVMGIAVPVRPSVALDNTPYTQLRNWRTRPLPALVSICVADMLEGIAMDLIDCDDPDSNSSLQNVCDDLDKLYGLPGRGGLEGVA